MEIIGFNGGGRVTNYCPIVGYGVNLKVWVLKIVKQLSNR